MESWIGQNFGEIVKLVIYTGGLLVAFGKLSQQVKDMRDAVKEIRNDLNTHCDDDDVHINKKFYDALMTRLNSIELKLDNRNEQSGRIKGR